jgi:RNA polymerase sigma factor (sigma-70 family)
MKGQYWFKEDEDNIINYIQGKDKHYKPVYESFDKLINKILSSKRFNDLDIHAIEELNSDIHVHLYDKIYNFDISKATKGKNNPVYLYFSHLIFCEVYKRFNRRKDVSLESYHIDIIDDLEYKELVEDRLIDIRIVVEGLNDHQKVLFRMYFYEDLDMKEIAEKLDVTPNFVFQQLRDLRIEIRNQLGLTGELPKIRQRRRLS